MKPTKSLTSKLEKQPVIKQNELLRYLQSKRKKGWGKKK